MAIALYVDENVPRQITYGLRLRGVDVISVQEDRRNGMPDPLILERAIELQRVLFTRDDDFLIIAKPLPAGRDSLSGYYLCTSTAC